MVTLLTLAAFNICSYTQSMKDITPCSCHPSCSSCLTNKDCGWCPSGQFLLWTKGKDDTNELQTSNLDRGVCWRGKPKIIAKSRTQNDITHHSTESVVMSGILPLRIMVICSSLSNRK